MARKVRPKHWSEFPTRYMAIIEHFRDSKDDYTIPCPNEGKARSLKQMLCRFMRDLSTLEMQYFKSPVQDSFDLETTRMAAKIARQLVVSIRASEVVVWLNLLADEIKPTNIEFKPKLKIVEEGEDDDFSFLE